MTHHHRLTISSSPPPYPPSASLTRASTNSFSNFGMSFHSISSTYPEPATSPSPRSSPTPNGPIHAPLRRTYAFYIPRKISAPVIRPTQSNSATSKSRRTKTRRCKGGQPTRSSLRAWKKARGDQDEEPQSELEKTMAPPAKRRKIKED